jgi:hypothetical protein
MEGWRTQNLHKAAMREERQGRGCNYENDLEIAMFKYRASVGETLTWDRRKAKSERAGAKDWRPGRVMSWLEE